MQCSYTTVKIYNVRLLTQMLTCENKITNVGKRIKKSGCHMTEGSEAKGCELDTFKVRLCFTCCCGVLKRPCVDDQRQRCLFEGQM